MCSDARWAPWARGAGTGGALLRLAALAVLAPAVAGWSWHFDRLPRRLEMDEEHHTVLNLTLAAKDIVKGLPVDRVTLVFDRTVDARFRRLLTASLHRAQIVTQAYSIDGQPRLDAYTEHVRQTMARYEGMTSVIFCSRTSSESLLDAIRHKNLIQRNLLYMFYVELWPPGRKFVDTLQEAMRVAVISNPRPGTFRVYYTQATAEGSGTLRLVNWWSGRLFRYPVLPPAARVYKDLRGRTLQVPVLHKPPWNFVTYTNKTFLVEGGRDHQLLLLLAQKLHFNFQYFDPPERSQGSAFVETLGNKTFPGILGLISERRADLTLGDVTITYERSLAVEFSFLTLADSGAFVTKAPSRLNEALALVRPFQTEQVWPVLVLTVLLTGPLLFGVLEAPRLWRGKAWAARRFRRGRQPHSDAAIFWSGVWFSLGLFFKQSVRGPDGGLRVRLLTILLSFAATYVIGDMYSANLTSMLARPGRERPISNLEELAAAMETRGYQLLVEQHSASYNILENGTGVYERLWRLMRRQRGDSHLESGEDGMVRVGREANLAMLGGRETLYFDARRFGAHRFHLSEKLFTRYSAIALQIGCPYIERVNDILMQLFEAGILTKMTEEEYEKLGDKLHDPDATLADRTTPPKSAPGGDGEADQGGSSGCGEDRGSGQRFECGDEEYYDYPGRDAGHPGRGDDDDGDDADYEDTEEGYTDAADATTAPTSTTTTPPPPVVPELPSEGSDPGRSSASSTEEKSHNPISIAMLQGAFYALLAGYLLAGLVLWAELAVKRSEGCSCLGRAGCLGRRHWEPRCPRCLSTSVCWTATKRCVRQAGQHARHGFTLALAEMRTISEEDEDVGEEVQDEVQGDAKEQAVSEPPQPRHRLHGRLAWPARAEWMGVATPPPSPAPSPAPSSSSSISCIRPFIN